MVHRVGRTLILDEFDIHKHLLRTEQVNLFIHALSPAHYSKCSFKTYSFPKYNHICRGRLLNFFWGWAISSFTFLLHSQIVVPYRDIFLIRFQSSLLQNCYIWQRVKTYTQAISPFVTMFSTVFVYCSFILRFFFVLLLRCFQSRLLQNYCI